MSLQQSLLEILSVGTTNYLNGDYFGVMPWNWHSQGKIRANRLNAYLEVPAIRSSEQYLLVLFMLVLRSGAKQLKECITNLFVDSPTFKHSYITEVRTKTENKHTVDRYEICESILRQNITIDLDSKENKEAFALLLKDFESNSEFSTDNLVKIKPF